MDLKEWTYSAYSVQREKGKKKLTSKHREALRMARQPVNRPHCCHGPPYLPRLWGLPIVPVAWALFVSSLQCPPEGE
uniref:Uncharacterized protein n=1 Tax=Romanomermis culicivorax TaxID=13658 RepID=A0A915J1D8_ROMCU